MKRLFRSIKGNTVGATQLVQLMLTTVELIQDEVGRNTICKFAKGVEIVSVNDLFEGTTPHRQRSITEKYVP